MTAAQVGACIRQLLLFLYYFEVAPQRRFDHVNPAFHLIDAPTRKRLAAGISGRAKHAGMTVDEFWQDLLQFWVFPPDSIADDAALAIKVIAFNRLLHGSDPTHPGPTAPSNSTTSVGSRKRAFRARSRVARGVSASNISSGHLTHRDAEFICEAASFLGQHHGLVMNLATTIVITGGVTASETAMSNVISQLTHELRMRVVDWAGADNGRAFHWVYTNVRTSAALTCHLLAHVPYAHLEAAKQWIAAKSFSVDDTVRISINAEGWDPQPRNPRTQETSRVKFQWQRVRQLLSPLEPGRLVWGTDGTRQPLRAVLGLPDLPPESLPITIKRVGASHSLLRAARRKAEANKMALVSAFREGAWGELTSGWELMEHKDRVREAEYRAEQLARLDALSGESTALEKRRDEEDLASLLASWPDDPKDRPRSWNPWWATT